MTQLLNVSVSDGKYTVIQEADGRLHALRHGQPWGRDIVGDTLVLCLAQELAQAREDLTDAKELIDSLEQALAPKPHMICKATLHGSPETGWRLTKPATLEQAAEDAARMHSQMEADGTLRQAPLLDADFASLEARVLAFSPMLDAVRHVAKAGTSVEDIEKALHRAAGHLRGSGTTASKIDTLRHSLRWVSTGEPCEAPASERTAPNFHAQADHAARTPLFDPDKAVATFRKEIDMAVGTLLAKLNTKA